MHKHTLPILAVLMATSILSAAGIRVHAYISPGDFIDTFGEDTVNTSDELNENTSGRARSRRVNLQNTNQNISSASSTSSVSSISSSVLYIPYTEKQSVVTSSMSSSSSSSFYTSSVVASVAQFQQSSLSELQALPTSVVTSSQSIGVASSFQSSTQLLELPQVHANSSVSDIVTSSLSASSVQSEQYLYVASSAVSSAKVVNKVNVVTPVERVKPVRTQFSSVSVIPFAQQNIGIIPVSSKPQVAPKSVRPAAPTPTPSFNTLELPVIPPMFSSKNMPQYIQPNALQFPNAVPPQWIQPTTPAEQLSTTGVPHSVLAFLVAIGSTSSFFYTRRMS